MAGKGAVSSKPASSFDYVLVEGDSDNGDTFIASSNRISPWTDLSTIKLRHRIGRGPFGDVWLANHHSTSNEYEGYHEVAIKILHPVSEDAIRDVLDKLDEVAAKCRGLETVCWLHGLSVIAKKVCIIMKFYEGSLGDKMARLKDGKLSPSDVLRYGISLAQGIIDLHAKQILVLNLKPSNFLLTTDDQAVIGDFGIPFMLLGTPNPSTDVVRHFGTPNYMAPEQWQPEVRGPLSFETDSWGFGCSILEMLTGIQPWRGKSAEEIYKLVVLKGEKPQIPNGLPPAIENVIIGCFEYDLRNRPLMKDILHAFQSSHSEFSMENWSGTGSTTIKEIAGYSEWFLAKDHLQVGDTVRSRKLQNSRNQDHLDIPEGTVVGFEVDTDFVLVRVLGVHDPVRVNASTLERITYGLSAGDWVRLKNNEKKHSPVGVIHSIDRDGTVSVACIGLETLRRGDYTEYHMAKPYSVGQFVKLKSSVFSPLFEWPRKRGGEWATGRIHQVLPNGCLMVKFPGIATFGHNDNIVFGDPAEVEPVSFNTCHSLINKYQHLEDIHWAIRPLLAALGLFTVFKLLGRGKRGSKTRNKVQDVKPVTPTGNAAVVWRPPNMTNIFG